MSLWKKINVGFGLALLVLGAVGLISYRSTTQMAATAARVDHTYEVLFVLAEINSSLQEVETETRGYMLSGRPDFLTNYSASTLTLQRDLPRLYWLTRDNPYRQRQLDAMQPLVNQRLVLLEQSLALRRAAPPGKSDFPEQAAQASRQGALMARGDALEERAGAVSSQMEADERRLLMNRTTTARATARATQAIILVGYALALGLVALASGRIQQDIRMRLQAEQALRDREQLLKLITDAAPALIGYVGPDLRYQFVNQGYLDFFELPQDSIVGRTMEEFLGPQAYATVRDYAATALTGHQVSYETAMAYPGVGERFIRCSYSPHCDPGGSPCGFVIMVSDITGRREAEEALRCANERLEVRVQERTAQLSEQQAFLRQVIDTDTNFIFVKDADGRFLLANTAVAEAYGATPEALVGRCDADFNPNPEELEQFRSTDRELLSSGVAQITFEEAMTDAQGHRRLLQTVKRPLSAPSGAPARVLGICTDITARKALEEERERLLRRTEELLVDALERADHDPLTGLANHRAYHKRLGEEADRAQREGRPLAVAVLDLDNFKFFNDCYGHPVGDEVLQSVAAALRDGGRSYDTLARYGGDEFALLLPGVGLAEAAQVPARLAARLAQVGYTPPGYDTVIPIGAAVGVAVFPDEAPTRTEALELADTRLRRAKSGGATDTEADEVRLAVGGRVAGFSMLDALVTAVDNKDRYTHKHSEDVLIYSLQIARELGLGERTLHAIGVAALLHDVGKIGIPDAILRKPGRLTDGEFEAIQQHPLMGAAIVGAVPGFEETLDAVRHHHERWDGGGYPFGLKGEETPLIARLMAVADAFSAMTTDRPYRKGMDEARALSILESGAGTQWDPACVQAFLSVRLTPAECGSRSACRASGLDGPSTPTGSGAGGRSSSSSVLEASCAPKPVGEVRSRQRSVPSASESSRLRFADGSR